MNHTPRNTGCLQCVTKGIACKRANMINYLLPQPNPTNLQNKLKALML